MINVAKVSGYPLQCDICGKPADVALNMESDVDPVDGRQNTLFCTGCARECIAKMQTYIDAEAPR